MSREDPTGFLKQMRNEALDMLVLWAASKEYSAVSGGRAASFVGTLAASTHNVAHALPLSLSLYLQPLYVRTHTRTHPAYTGDRGSAQALGVHV